MFGKEKKPVCEKEHLCNALLVSVYTGMVMARRKASVECGNDKHLQQLFI